jgi:hypothetical protein
MSNGLAMQHTQAAQQAAQQAQQRMPQPSRSASSSLSARRSRAYQDAARAARTDDKLSGMGTNRSETLS